MYYIALKKSDMSSEISSESDVLRSVDAGEIVEYLEGPTKDGEKDTVRVKCVTHAGKISGWLSVNDSEAAILESLMFPRLTSSSTPSWKK